MSFNPLEWLGPEGRQQVVSMGIQHGGRVLGQVVRDLGEQLIGSSQPEERPEPQLLPRDVSPYRAMMGPLAEALAAAQNYIDCTAEHAGHHTTSDTCLAFTVQYREEMLLRIAQAIAAGTTPDTVQDRRANALLEQLNKLVISPDPDIPKAQATIARAYRDLRRLAEHDETERLADDLDDLE